MNILPKRCLLKLSGEILLGPNQNAIAQDAALDTAKRILSIRENNIEIGIVIGGGNLFRGIQTTRKVFSRRASDHLGMLATMMNAIALQEAFTVLGKNVEIFSGLDCPKIAKNIYLPHILHALKHDGIVIFAGGTGNPYFTTDTASVLRAREIGADLLIKATKVSHVFDRDPLMDPNAKPYHEINYRTCIEKQLKFMDASALLLAEEGGIDLFVCRMQLIGKKTLKEILSSREGTWVKEF